MTDGWKMSDRPPHGGMDDDILEEIKAISEEMKIANADFRARQLQKLLGMYADMDRRTAH